MNRRRLRRWALRIVAALLFLTLAGATYQGVATALERRTYPRPGGMVDVGGHQLHIFCSGEGAPTVVLEAPAAGMSAAWGRVQPQVASLTRVCSYDRAGLGWSERSDGPYDPAATDDELGALLSAANERPPFVVAGHGLGGAFARLFASRSGGDVAVLVLADAPVSIPPSEPAELMDRPGALPWLARTGIMRLSGMLLPMTDSLPDPARGALAAFLWRPDHLSRTAEELEHWSEIVEASERTRLPPSTRVTIVDALGPTRVGFLATEREAARVAAAILDAVRQVRGVEQGAVPGATRDVP